MPDGRDLTVVFDGSFEGLLTIVHKRYYDKLKPERIVRRDCYQDTLFAEYVEVETDYAKAETVMKAIAERISAEARETAYTAFCAEDDNRYIDIYRYILLGFAKGRDADNHMRLDYVLNVQGYAKLVSREAHLFKGFLRFNDAGNGIFIAKLEPVNNILPFLAEHFADRFAGQAWIIHDVKRKLAAVSDGGEFVIYEGADEQPVRNSAKEPVGGLPSSVSGEDIYHRLWRGFVSHIAVEGRKNAKLQRQLLPKRYRRFMTEFQLERD